jgi:superfamily I DNA and/or RNA helicase
MEATLHKYKNRLVDLSSKNRSLSLKKIYNRRAFDTFLLNEFDNQKTKSLLDFVVKRSEGKIKLLDSPYSKKISEKDRDLIISRAKNLKNLKDEIDLVEKEKGSYDLFLGYLFAEGCFIDKTFFRAPLLLFSVKIFNSDNEWFLSNNLDQNIQINRTFVLAYQQYNEAKISDFELEFEELQNNNIEEWIINYLNENKVEINNESYLSEQTISRFTDYIKSKNTIPNYKAGDIFLKKHLVLGQFPISNSSLNEDYKKMIENTPSSGLVHELLSNEIEGSEEYMEHNLIDEDESRVQISEKKSYFLTNTDYSQEKAVILSKETNQLVIYGPPGTGKSQVIVNLIADNLANRKKVLMVSQKRAALDVVYNRLARFGLHTRIGFVHDYNRDWNNVFQKVQDVLNDETNYSHNDLYNKFDELSSKIDNNLDKLEKIAKLLHSKSKFGLTLYQLYSEGKNETEIYINNIFDNFSQFSNLSFNEIEKYSDEIDKLTPYIKYDLDTNLLSNRKDFSDFPEIEKGILLNILNEILDLDIKIKKQISPYYDSTQKTYSLLENNMFHVNKTKKEFIDKYNLETKDKVDRIIIKLKTIFNVLSDNFISQSKNLISKVSTIIKIIDHNKSLINRESPLLDKTNYQNISNLSQLCNEISSLSFISIKYWKLFFQLKKTVKNKSLKEIISSVIITNNVKTFLDEVNKIFNILSYEENPDYLIDKISEIQREFEIVIIENKKINNFNNLMNKDNEYIKISEIDEIDNNINYSILLNEMNDLKSNFDILNSILSLSKNIILFLDNLQEDFLLESTIFDKKFLELKNYSSIVSSKIINSKYNKEYDSIIDIKSLNLDLNDIKINYDLIYDLNEKLNSIKIKLSSLESLYKYLTSNSFKEDILKDKIISEKLLSEINSLKLLEEKFKSSLDSIPNLNENTNKSLNIDLGDTNTQIEHIKLNEIIIQKISFLNKYFLDSFIYKIKSLLFIDSELKEKINLIHQNIVNDFSNVVIFDQLKKRLNLIELNLLDECKNKFDEVNLGKSKKAILNTFYLKWISIIEKENLEIMSDFNHENEIRELTSKLILDKKDLNLKYIENILNKDIKDSRSYNRNGNEVTFKDIKKESEKKRNKMSLRKFVSQFHSSGLFKLLPCWLVTPEVASAIFPLKQDLFDIVIFDEASQMFVEQGIPALYRASRVVIAGDDKQLQPSDLYSVKLDEEENEINEDEYIDNSVLEIKSILDLAKIKYKSSTLTYHYRADFEELINFSNYAFYNGRIQIIPNRVRNYDNQPIERIKVDGRWIERQNVEEGNRVISLVREILQNRRNDETIGIITFNSTQKDLIIDLLDNECQKDISFRELYTKEINRKNGDEDISIFVKNIENVQGDERDIIIFCVGYAPNEKGRVSANFGTLNKEYGENRLNVAISRAKKKIYLVTSIEPEDIHVEESKNEGPKLFKSYLKYVRAVSDNNKEEVKTILESVLNKNNINKNKSNQFDSPFEEEVYNSLIKLGYDVHTQVGSSGYKIDLAIYDPKKSEFVLGVECDGAMYHSSKSARERDIYRQKFLESKGWKIHRIWSKNWWRDPQKEIVKIKNILDLLIRS